jgi:1,4-dihydroxy-2-naphthoyl-CoA hydrolase
MPITDKARQPYGLLHGGISMVLAETAASMHACWGVDLTKMLPVGIEINGSHVRSAKEGVVRAEGKVVRRTRSIIVHQVDIILDETDQLLCTARVTNFYKKVGEDNT